MGKLYAALQHLESLPISVLMPFWQRSTNEDVIRWAITRPEGRVVIFPACYTTNKKGNRLTDATEINLLMAIKWHKQTMGSYIVIGNYDYNGLPERRLKENLLRETRVDPKSILWIPQGILNSADEARKAANAVKKANIEPTAVLAITGGMHARTARLVCDHEFPNADILVDCTPWRYETQPDHLIPIQRDYILWFTNNLARTFVLKCPKGFELIMRSHHTVAGK